MKALKILLIILLGLLVGCKKDVKEDTLQTVTLTNADNYYTYAIEDFRLEKIKLKLLYESGKSEETSLSLEMLSENDINKLFTTGVHEITINYQGFTLNTLIEITGTDHHLQYLPSVVMFYLTEVKDGWSYAHFYTTGTSEYLSFQVQYGYDETQVSNLSFELASTLTGSLVHNLDNGKIFITYIQDEPIEGLTEIFTIRYQTQSNTSPFVVNYVYDNAFYSYNDTTVFAINNIAFYER